MSGFLFLQWDIAEEPDWKEDYVANKKLSYTIE